MSPRIAGHDVSWLAVASFVIATAGALLAIALYVTDVGSIVARCIPLVALFAASVLAFEGDCEIDASEGRKRGRGFLLAASAAWIALAGFGVVPLLQGSV